MKFLTGSSRNRFVRIAWLAVIIVLAATGLSTPGDAAGMDPSMVPTTGEAAARAEHIVWARVETIDIRAESGGPWAYSKFRTLKRIKGNIGETFILRLFFVGKFGNAEYVVTDMAIPEFRDGEEFILFLGEKNSQGYPVLDVDNVFRVDRDGKDWAMVSPSPDRLPLYGATSGKLHESPPADLTLEDFLFSLGKALGCRDNC